MSLLIKNGEIVTASERYVADILCENETITRIDRGITPPKGVEVIDAKGKFVFPGFIDPHVHIYLPFMGTMAKDEFDFGFAIDWMRKDLGLALDEARANGATLDIARLVDGYYAEVQAMGGGRQDTSALVRRLPQ